MSVDTLLSRLERVKRTGEGRWTARCPAHDDKGPSLAIRELDDGRILIHDFAGCDVHSILATIDLDVSALFPEREITHGRPERRPWPASDVLRCIAFEAMVIAAAVPPMLSGEFGQVDRERVMTAAARIQAALTAGGLSYE